MTFFPEAKLKYQPRLGSVEVGRSSVYVTIAGASVFMLPGIKFFMFSSLPNLLVLTCLLILASFKLRRISLNLFQVRALVTLVFCLLIFLVSAFNSHISVTFETLARFLTAWLILFLIIILAQTINFSQLASLLLSWSVFISVIYLFGIITVSGAGNLSYLNLAMQVCIGIALASGRLSFSKHKLLHLILTLFLFMVLLTLASRGALLAAAVVLVINFTILLVAAIKRMTLKLFGTLAVLLVAVRLASTRLGGHVNEYLLYKILEVELTETSRYWVYTEAIKAFASHPFGLGFQGYKAVLGYYPHNLYLEVGLDFGVVGLAVAGIVTLKFLFDYFCAVFSFSAGSLELGSFAISMLIIWQFSFDLGSAYMVFGAIILFFASRTPFRNGEPVYIEQAKEYK
ncbi:O-antigen ligase family protein [Sulfitobacter sp. 915]|uniref:O-antigen ligase family protein n=1 Tax=Sulfitobacter sp. 915 TaxID=3368558 RepID=UPI003745707D